LKNTKEHISIENIKKLDHYLQNGLSFRKNVPGGLLKYSPNRSYSMKGDGRGIDKNGKFVGTPIHSTFYTAGKNASNITLESFTEQIPQEFIPIIQFARGKFQQKMGGKISDYTFNMGVCNLYDDPKHKISAHTDDNEHYPKECNFGPVFASLTVYPDKKPRKDDEYANFEIRPDLNKPWQKVILRHMSLMIMPAGILHRVRQAKAGKFCKRINITFRSAFSPQENPLMYLMALSNHTRYYGCPKKLYVPTTVSKMRKNEVLAYYTNHFAVDIEDVNIDKNEKKMLSDKYKKKSGFKGKMKAIYVLQTIQKALGIVDAKRKKRKIYSDDCSEDCSEDCNCPIYIDCKFGKFDKYKFKRIKVEF
jgi:hypothetical protein